MTRPKSSYVVSYNDVTNSNFDSYFPEIVAKIKKASHVAVDLEFTSLGNVRSTDMNHRYVAMKETVEAATIASIGLSIVRDLTPTDQESLTTTPEDNFPKEAAVKTQKYVCDNYNLLSLKQGDITIQSGTGQFLCQHGYSFDAMFTKGIPFTPPSSLTTSTKDMRFNNLWKKMMAAMRLHNIPLVLHNGLYDLIYLYHCFIDKLPDTFGRFLLQVTENFPSGLYDTRYMANKADFDATFLVYVFSKSDRLRQNRFNKSVKQAPYFEVEINEPMMIKQSTSVKRKREPEQEDKRMNMKYCAAYADRGYCGNTAHTDRTPDHDVQIILDSKMGPSEYPQVYTSRSDEEEGAHAAHFDAYMTGFNFCYFQNTFSPTDLKSCLNRMMIRGSEFPLVFPMKKSKR